MGDILGKSILGCDGLSIAAGIGDKGTAVPEHCSCSLTTPAVYHTHTHTDSRWI